MQKRPARFIMTLLATIMMLTALSPAVLAAPAISGECACLYLPAKDLVLYGKNEEKRHAMASTTKIMTALTVLSHCSLDEVVTVSPDATGIEGSSAYLKADQQFTVESLLYALLLASANDAAAALAIHTAGSVEEFAALMKNNLGEGDAVLFKARRSMKLEEIIEAIFD